MRMTRIAASTAAEAVAALAVLTACGPSTAGDTGRLRTAQDVVEALERAGACVAGSTLTQPPGQYSYTIPVQEVDCTAPNSALAIVRVFQFANRAQLAAAAALDKGSAESAYDFISDKDTWLVSAANGNVDAVGAVLAGQVSKS